MGQIRIKNKYIYRWLCMVLLSVLATISFFLVWREFVKVNNQTGSLMGKGNLLMAAGIYFVLYHIVGKALKAFRIGVDRKANLLASQVLTLFSVDAIEVLVSCAITGQFRFFPNFLWRYVLLAFGQSVVLCLLVIPMVDLYRHFFKAHRVLEIWDSRSAGKIGVAGELSLEEYDKLHFMNGRPDKFHIEKIVNINEGLDKIYGMMEPYDAVFINDIPSEIKNDILKECFSRDIRVYFTPKISDIIGKNSEEINLFDTPLYLCRNAGLSLSQRIVKRTCDIVFSLIGLVLTSPILLVTALAIKLEDGGPVFFRQERATLGGKEFSILKFRSMIVDAEKDGRPHPAGEKDPRITKVGNVIRATRIDELPQILNILKGDMSIVGPRPERLEHVQKYCEEIPEFKYRLKVKGGLTGPAQVFGKYNTSPLNKLKMDLFYITNYSLLLDLQILFETVKILVQKESTEGFTQERVQEMHDAGAGDGAGKDE
ncbi:sugar transferase [Butyrivibrio sp. XBB1001]|uniref:sugar transferase n=1 Tax=Butyrivibrio sp. XBB1001 TaxID=1280682 RepID=UPI000687B28E|nr:sugar transferase [Butyrivibrio sp. XBB1001]